jgi:shikimate dehydrogenase
VRNTIFVAQQLCDESMTRLFTILGDPIAQVRSPSLFNERFRSRGIDAVMTPVHVGAADFTLVLAMLRRVRNLDGLVITVPHKASAASAARACSRRVEIAQAANALRPIPGGWECDLFDGEGFAIGLEVNGIAVSGKNVAIVGAGGAGAAIAVAVLDRGANVRLFDLDRPRVERTAARLSSFFARDIYVGLPGPWADIAVNATPLGMRDGDPLPFDLNALRAGTIVADIIMKPPVTSLLHEAAQRGFSIQPGRYMLDCQMDSLWSFFHLF